MIGSVILMFNTDRQLALTMVPLPQGYQTVLSERASSVDTCTECASRRRCCG